MFQFLIDVNKHFSQNQILKKCYLIQEEGIELLYVTLPSLTTVWIHCTNQQFHVFFTDMQTFLVAFMIHPPIPMQFA